MNDRHPSGVSTPADSPADSSYGPYGSPYDQSAYGHQGSQDTSYGYVTGTFDTLGAAYGEGDPLFGPLPTDASQPSAGQAMPSGDAWTGDTGQHAVYDGYPATAWTHIPAQAAPHPDETGHGWTDSGYGTGVHADPAASPDGIWTGDTGQHAVYDGYSATAWDEAGSRPPAEPEAPAERTAAFEAPGACGEHGEYGEYEAYAPAGADEAGASAGSAESAESAGFPEFPGAPDSGWPDAPDAPDVSGALDTPGPARPEEYGEGPRNTGPSARPAGSRRRRSARPKRSALLTVAVPSVCVMGVTAVAAASVSGVGDEADDTTTQAAPDAASAVKTTAANSKLDTQLAGLSDEAEGFADRASRTQERIDLKERQEAERKRKAAEAARKEAMRPKFALPVAQHGLSAYYGQAGINWMSLHTGLDFPVGYGTPVMAATDGTVRTQWNSAYGNMAIVTAPDGTETWYCHLSSTRIRSGYVKAGDTIAYSGNSGNSTGPHLHFEVRPAGGAAIDPLPWFRSKGLDPT
ncbi:peptidoglycan DD-metalloendopeptidase family protein [Streptomyces sp. DH37]|uniref:peptidoglycan DD-metalloendopeptidase family protein n=1 Tax=Streptomyces sp. DH37 TaxID=3040122 RepID=UPI00244150B0|nr:peptidoglycan DD-metalloendopeptidase family protein [Streptomyces sp. DH37]MDG9705613.1 peptidoglycan DD-metalloendopeptidase family protein [Streptomyces sp. DH37]